MAMTTKTKSWKIEKGILTVIFEYHISGEPETCRTWIRISEISHLEECLKEDSWIYMKNGEKIEKLSLELLEHVATQL